MGAPTFEPNGDLSTAQGADSEAAESSLTAVVAAREADSADAPLGADALVNSWFRIAYDGTDFRGLAPNVDVRTVVGELQRVLEPLVGFVPEIVMSGRTDAGVHAWDQVLSARLPVNVPLDRIQKSTNSRLGPEIVVRDLGRADDGFSARFSAVGRQYRYRILNTPQPNPFWDRFVWWYSTPLDTRAMNEAAQRFVGTHDFSSFCRAAANAAGEPLSLVRRVDFATVTGIPLDAAPQMFPNLGELSEPSTAAGSELVEFHIGGSAFCHQMVRSIVGFLVAVGAGKRSPDDVVGALAAKDRHAADQLAPAKGLTLWRVQYPNSVGLDSSLD